MLVVLLLLLYPVMSSIFYSFTNVDYLRAFLILIWTDRTKQPIE